MIFLKKTILTFFFVFLLLFGIVVNQTRFVLSAETMTAPDRLVSIFLHDSNGTLTELVVPIHSNERTPLAAALHALFTYNVPSDLHREIPSGTQLNSVKLKDNIAYIDLSKEFIDNLTENHDLQSIMESILYTSFAFPEVKTVYFTVEGKNPGKVYGAFLGEPFFRSETPAPDPNSIKTKTDASINVIIVPAPKVYVDPGHGGTDPGAVASDGTKEKDIVLDAATRLKDYLTSNKAIAKMSRTSDVYIEPCDRASDANTWNADVFVSVHANSTTNTSTRGTEAIYPNNHDISQSSSLATYIHNQLTKRYPASPRGVYQDSRNLCVLRNTAMPATLVELLYLSNSQDLNLLKSSSERDWMAYYIYQGIKNWWCDGNACEWN